MRSAQHNRIWPAFPCGARLRIVAVSWLILLFLVTGTSFAADYSAVQKIFDKHCVDCHASQEPEGGLVMENFEAFMKGGQTGPPVVAGKSDESVTIKMVEGRIEKEGKKLIMPPGKRKKLSADEIATIRAWIDAGAKPSTEIVTKELDLPKIEPTVPPRRSINALAYSRTNQFMAVGRHNEVELIALGARARVRTLSGHRGAVNALVFSPDGKHVFAAAGETAISGEVRQWSVPDGKLVRAFEGHTDALYALAISPDGKILATGSYDQKIKLWDAGSGKELRTLSGHNGAVFGLAFRPDGKLLASASADRTVKLWDVESGERRDTLSQPLKEQHAIAFSRDGKRLVAGGADNRLRVWEISENAAETTNPLIESRFAHEGAILRIVFAPDGKTLASSADDRTVKLWGAEDLKQRLVLESQPDWPTGLSVTRDPNRIVVGRLDGTLEFYDAKTGAVAPPPPPLLASSEPRGIQRGVSTRIRLAGSNLVNLTEFRTSNSNLTGRVVGDEADTPSAVSVEIQAAADLRPGPYEVWVKGKDVESEKIKLHVDTLPQVVETNGQTNAVLELPVNVWGSLAPMGDADEFQFEAEAGDTIVLDLRAKAFESKANAVLTLMDAEGKVIASNNDYDGIDPFLADTIKADGRYTVRVSELMLGGSADHFYRLSMGKLPYITGGLPLSVPVGKDTEVSLVGHNLPPGSSVKIAPEKAGDTDLPVDPEKFRARRTFKVVATDLPAVVEAEPNDEPGQATSLMAPAVISGRIWSKNATADTDYFRLEAKKGQAWIIETQAARKGSPVDTRIEVLHADGKPVERVVLQGVRDSMINFRPINSEQSGARLDNWEEMELNQYLYLNGEVVKLFRMPQGPDSEMVFYTQGGKRRPYFDTTGIAHALEEPCYIIEPHPPGAKLVDSGLPTFTLYYSNDDDAERKLGSDSRLHFTAPKDGSYVIRVADTRGEQGERFSYSLVVRKPEPGFKVALAPQNITVPAGSGQEFTLTAERIDGFDGAITIDISGLPRNFSASTPLVIEAGHTEAKGTLNATLDAPKPEGSNASMARVIARAEINGVSVTNEVKNFGAIKLGEQPKVFVLFEPYPAEGATNASTPPYELTIGPGQTIPAMLRIKRNGHQDLVTFTVQNLPHGVIVDNIGLNGVLIPKGEDERDIFLSAQRWVPETDRWCFAIEGQAGKQTSIPLLLRVRKDAPKVAIRPATTTSGAGGDKP